MKHHEQIEIEAAKVVAELFAGNASQWKPLYYMESNSDVRA